MILFQIFGYACIAFLICLTIVALLGFWQYIRWFHNRKCKHCGKRMEYKGLKENPDESHFLFHCEHCGAWEQIPKHNMVRE